MFGSAAKRSSASSSGTAETLPPSGYLSAARTVVDCNDTFIGALRETQRRGLTDVAA